MSDEIFSSIWEWLGKGVKDSFIPIFLSTVVSLLANKMFIQRNQRKRLHSETINDEAFKPWNEKINLLCSIGLHTPVTEYSHEEKKIIPVKLKNLDLILHHNYLMSHMKTGYSKTWDLWTQLRNLVESYYGHMAQLMETIRTNIREESSQFDLFEYYHRLGRRPPDVYYKPDKMAVAIYKEIDKRLEGMDPWLQGEPTIAQTMIGSVRINHLDVPNESNLVYNITDKKMDFFRTLLLRFVENEEYIGEVKNLRNAFIEIIKKRDEFQGKLKEIISKIDNGYNLKGRCDAC